jgi:hypothetical protein
MSIEKSNYLFGTRTRYIPPCQPVSTDNRTAFRTLKTGATAYRTFLMELRTSLDANEWAARFPHMLLIVGSRKWIVGL